MEAWAKKVPIMKMTPKQKHRKLNLIIKLRIDIPKEMKISWLGKKS